MRSIKRLFDKRPLRLYLFVVTILFFMELTISVNPFIRNWLIFLLCVSRAFVAFKIVRFLKESRGIVEHCLQESVFLDQYKNHYNKAIRLYLILAFICISQVTSMVLVAFSDFYYYIFLFLVLNVAVFFLDVFGISRLYIVYSDKQASTSKYELSWIISVCMVVVFNIAWFLCVVIYKDSNALVRGLYFITWIVFGVYRFNYAYETEKFIDSHRDDALKEDKQKHEGRVI